MSGGARGGEGGEDLGSRVCPVQYIHNSMIVLMIDVDACYLVHSPLLP